ncbi:MAG TPA: TRAP transporter substrate-binding protein [Burkholderiaceae bacterium]
MRYLSVITRIVRTVAFAATLLPSCSFGQAVRLELASAYSAETFQTQNTIQFAADVKSDTGGALDIAVHPSGSLLKPAAIFGGVKDGKPAQLGEIIMSNLSQEDVAFGLDSLPFFVGGYDDAQTLWRLSRPAVEKALDARGLLLLYATPWPPQNLYADRPIDTPADFHGLRMRDYGPSTERLAQLMGVGSVTIQMVDLGQAIADKKIDIMLTSNLTGIETHAWNGMRYYYKVNAWIPKNIVFINKAAFAALKPEMQKTLVQDAARAEERGWQWSRAKDGEFEARLAAHNMQIANVNPYVRRFLDITGEKLVHEYLGKVPQAEAGDLMRILVDYSMAHAKH